MCFTIDQIEQACGILLLTEFNTFLYCCKKCPRKFETGFHLEVHILSKHKDDKEAVFVHENVFVDEFEPIPVEYESSNVKTEEFELNTDVFDESNSEDHTVDEIRPLTVLLVNENMDNDNNCIETNKVKDEVPFDETTEKHLEENIEPESNNMEMGTIYEESKRKHSPVSKRSNADVNPIEKVPTGLNNRKISIKTKTTNEQMAFYCDMCPDLSFKYKQSIRKHMTNRHAVKEMKRCEICNKFPRQSYEHHMKMKHSAHRFKCDHCDATFNRNTTRVMHMRTHTGEKPFLCSICGKAFSAKTNCSSHEIFVHKMVKKHQCQQCDRSFNRRDLLQDHINAIHTKERPHVCDICGKNYASRNTLQIHKSIHGEARLKCRYCDMLFKSRNNRRRHEMDFH